MAWDFQTDVEFEEKLAWMREFVQEKILPLETIEFSSSAHFAEAIKPLQDEVKDRGLWAAHLPVSQGGSGFGQVKLGLMHEISGRTILGSAIFGNAAPDSGNAELISLAGTEEQKQKWLGPLLEGTLHSAFSMTEPNAGADPTLLQCSAVLEGGQWIINGDKWFTSAAHGSDILIVMAVTDPEAKPHARASMIVVPTNTPGVTIVRDIGTMADAPGGFDIQGGHAEVTYRNVRVPEANLLGERGGAFALAQKRLGPGRIHHCMRWLGQAQRAFDMLCERAVSRYASGSLLSEKQMVQDWIATSAIQIHAARLMTLHAAWKIDTVGVKESLNEIAMIKVWGAQVLYEVIDRAIQAHGSLGFSTDMPLESMYRHARGARIYDGPDEVHKVSLSRRIVRNYEHHQVPSEHIPTRRDAAREKFAHTLAASI